MSKFALLAALAAFAVGTSVALKTAPVDTLKSARIRAKARLREALAVNDKVSNPDAMTSVKTHNESIDDVGRRDVIFTRARSTPRRPRLAQKRARRFRGLRLGRKTRRSR
jgi:hypothetical protein